MRARAPRWERFSILLLLLGGFALRLYQLGAQSLWYDETVSAFLASEPAAELIAHTARDIHPPLYYLLLRAWTRLVGDAEFALAFFSVIWSMLLLSLAHRLARHLGGQWTGLIAAALIALSPYDIWYAQEVRMYTMGAFLGLVTLQGLLRLWGEEAPASSRSGRAPWVVWVLAAALGLYTLYYFAFLLLAENAFALAYWWRRRRRDRAQADSRLARWMGAQVAVLLLYLPWLPIFYRQATDPPVPPWRSPVGIWTAAREAWTALTLGQSAEPRWAWPILVSTALLYGYALWAGSDERRLPLSSGGTRILLAGYTWLPVALILFLSRLLTPLFHVRYVFLYAATFYILLAWGIRRLGDLASRAGSTWRPVTILVVLAIYGIAARSSLARFWTDPRYAADDLRTGVRYIAQRLGPGDAVLINAGYAYTAFRYYYRGPIAWQGRLTDYPPEGIPPGMGAVIVQTGTVDGSPSLGWGDPRSDFYAMPWPQAEAALTRLFQRHPRVWVLRIYDTVTDPEGRIRSWLEEHGLLLDDLLLAGEANARVQAWRTYREPRFEAPAPQFPLEIAFGEDVLTLLGYNAPTMTIQAGEGFPLTLYWRWLARSDSLAARTDYAVSVGLFDGRGHRWAQWDEGLGAPLYPTSRWAPGEVMAQPMRLPVPLGIPPGEYSLAVTVYDPEATAPLSVADPERAIQGQRAYLGTVIIRRPDAWPRRRWPPMSRSASASFGGRIRLVRYEPPIGRARPGAEVRARLLWQAVRSPAEDYRVVLALLDEAGQPVITAAQPPALGLYPASRWTPGEVVLDEPALLIPGRVPPGRYLLAVGVQDARGRPLRWRTGLLRRGIYYPLGEIELTPREVNFEVPPIAYRVDARLGETIRLLGYDLDRREVQAGDALTLTLYWQALGEMTESFKVFNHLVGPDGQLHGQKDGYPANGQQPTSGWVPGEVIIDRYVIPVAEDAPPGTYRLLTGMYRERDLIRLPTFDADDRPLGDTIPLAEVTVTQPFIPTPSSTSAPASPAEP